MSCLYFPGFVAIPINADHDKYKESAAQTALERNKHEPGATATHQSRLVVKSIM